MKFQNTRTLLIVSLLGWALMVEIDSTSFAQGTAFTYQGRLSTGTNVAPNGRYDLAFGVFNVSSGPGQVGSSLTNSATAVTNGLFLVTLDFGPGVFSGQDRWLEVNVRTNGNGAFTTLNPRQKITATPYAITAGTLTGIVPAASLSGTYSSSVNLNNAANSFTGNGAGLTSLNASQLTTGTVPDGRLAANVARTNQVWLLNGNGGTQEGVNFMGTVDDKPLEFRVRNLPALRLNGEGSVSNENVNITAGSSVNEIGAGTLGAAILGGGSAASGPIISSSVPGVGSGSFERPGVHSNSIGSASHYALIGGGLWNTISSNAYYSVVGGGLDNQIGAFGQDAVIAGGYGNRIAGFSQFPTIGGGYLNYIYASNRSGTIAGGYGNRIFPGSDDSTIGGGFGNTIATNAQWATIPGGYDNLARGSMSFAAGRQAHALHNGTFVWADTSAGDDFKSTTNNQFLIRAANGVGINVTNPLDSVHLQSPDSVRMRTTALGTGYAGYLSENSLGEWFAGVATGTNHWYVFENAPLGGARMVIKSGGNVGIGTTNPTNKLHVVGGVSATAFVSTSDRNAKENFAPVSPQEVLAKVAALPIATWNFKDMPGAQHMGPTAQDFYAAFGLGGSDTTITTVDPDGVALAAIQALNQKLEQKENTIRQLELRLEKLEALLKVAQNGAKK